MALRMDKREEGLKELASMMAVDFRRRTAGEPIPPLNASGSNGNTHVSEAEITMRMEPSDSCPDLVYTETVGIKNFIRNKKRQDGHTESTQ